MLAGLEYEDLNNNWEALQVGIVKAQQVKGFWVADRIYRRDGTYVAVFNKHHCVLVTRPPEIKRKEWRQQGYQPVAVRDANRHLVSEPELWFWQKFVTDAEVPAKA